MLVMITDNVMDITHRLLRQQAEEISPTIFTEKQEACEARILAVAEGLMARHGRGHLTASALAAALRMSTAKLRWYFTDMDAVLGEILHRHLNALGKALRAVPVGPDRPRQARAAWLAHTRLLFGGFIPGHQLLVRDRHLLPEDMREEIEQRLHTLAMQLGPGREVETLALLDTPCLSPAQIEAMLATLDEKPKADLILRPPAISTSPSPSPSPSPSWHSPPPKMQIVGINSA
jgi:AcrR family transcriptional regulator